jgi:hypothetical protein
MGIYGIDYYAGTRFGRDPLLVRPDFSVAPFAAMPIDYQRLQLTWKIPPSTDCTQLCLLRNAWNIPQDETDGIALIPENLPSTTLPPLGDVTRYQSSNNVPAFLDVNPQPGINYYSMFGYDNKNSTPDNPIWIRCTDLIALLPVNYNNGDSLYNLLPGCYRDLDMVLVDPYNPWSSHSFNFSEDNTPPLQRYLNLIGFQLDFLRTEVDTLLNVNNADLISGALLPLLGYELGMINEPEIGMQQERALVGNAVHLYKLKGSGRGITEFSALLTSYPTMLAHKGYNLLLTRDDSIGESSIGTWEPSPAWGLWNSAFWTTDWAPATPFPGVGSPNLGLKLNYGPVWPDPVSSFPVDVNGDTLFPLDTLNPPYGGSWDPYNPTGISISVGQACNVDISTGAIPTLDFLSETDQPGSITWELSIYSPATRTIQLSVWADDGTGVPIQVVAPQNFTTVYDEWTRFRVSGPVTFGEVYNGFSNGEPNQNIPLTGPWNGQTEMVTINGAVWHRAPGNTFANVTTPEPVYVVDMKPSPSIVFGDGFTGTVPPNGAEITITYGHYDFLRPRLVIEGVQPFEVHQITLCCAWATVSANVGLYVPYYDYPRDIKVVLEPQSANLLANPLTTFAHGLDGWGCTSNDPLNINNVVTPQQWSFEGGTSSGYMPGPNTTLTPSPLGAEDGILCLAMTATAAGDISALSPSGINYAPDGTPGWWRLAWGSNDAGGNAYQVRTNFESSGPGRQCHVTYSWYDVAGNPLGTSTVGPITDGQGYGTYCSGTIVAPQKAVYLGNVTPYVAACAAGETHYVDDVWVQGLPLWGELTVNNTATVPHGTDALQVKVIEAPAQPPGCTVWAGTVTQFTPPQLPATGWFVDPNKDWFGGNRFGTTKTMYWFKDPVSGNATWSFVSGGSYFGIANTWMGGDWFPQPKVTQTANLVGFTAYPQQWLNFSIYAQALITTDALMEIGFRWYFADNTSVEEWMLHNPDNTWTTEPGARPVTLTDKLVRYDVSGEAPYQAITGNPPVLVFAFCRFPNAISGDLYLLNSALLAMGPTAPPFDDATLHPGSPDWIIDDKGSSFYYRRRAPRTARLRAEMYRWIPMGATYSLLFGSSMTEPAYDPTVWPP